MKYPETPAEVRCILRKMVDDQWFSNHENGDTIAMPRKDVLQAIEEFVRAIEGAYVGESTPTACERLVGALFVRAIEHAVTTGALDTNLVTIQET